MAATRLIALHINKGNLYWKHKKEPELFAQMMNKMDATYDPEECALSQWQIGRASCRERVF